ncbi:hypothetical protein [Clostridium sp. UBA1652]|uniref:hypothetical protein n=1 Tax=Clostridium sp. UBA1652 TaxID=1946348 RepID=UPI002579C67F|nr:hypothetical protein [Clostridium sp. UBA1652]
MNILDILKKLDYNVISFNSAIGIYEVRFNAKRIERMEKIIDEYKEKNNEGDEGKIGLKETLYLKVNEVKFNEIGNLYVSFSEEKFKIDLIDYYDSEEPFY